jgi:hypothetical protein
VDFHRLRLVFEKTHCVFYDEVVVQTEEFYDFFSDPRSDDLQVDFAHVYLRKERCEESETAQKR